MSKQKSMTAFGRDMQISRKHAREICSAIRGLKVREAKEYLKKVINHEKAVPFTRHVKEVPHRKGMATGRWPEKAAGQILKLVNSAKSNAEQVGNEEKGLYIKEIFASQGAHKKAYGGSRTMHRQGRQRSRTANISITLDQIKGYKPEKPKSEKKSKKEKTKKEKTKKSEKKEKLSEAPSSSEVLKERKSSQAGKSKSKKKKKSGKKKKKSESKKESKSKKKTKKGKKSKKKSKKKGKSEKK